MAHTSYSLEITYIEDLTVPLDFCFSDCFSINFSCTVDLIQAIQPTNPAADIYFSSSSITFDEAFLVPSYILCNSTPLTDFNTENTEILHQIFSSVPISSELLEEILAQLAESARKILSREPCGSLEMDVNLRVVTHIADEEDDFDVYTNDDDHRQNVSEVGRLVNLLERPKIVDEEEDGVEQCAVCLEEFGHGNEDSSGEVVRTNCSHVFHERCIFRWLERCIKQESPYSCPLCRSNMFPTSEHDE
ncbi:hypothetical protein PIB30_030866 [Stylosanthes scabra]|uniref:RING-type domain-containing protein n=1 Tax=Stylosanthes scabra TaxID=79078 RepID=A0ABU6VBU2_9FABA|nr:hypothetical protein [Stylosanthes scabra]